MILSQNLLFHGTQLSYLHIVSKTDKKVFQTLPTSNHTGSLTADRSKVFAPPPVGIQTKTSIVITLKKNLLSSANANLVD